MGTPAADSKLVFEMPPRCICRCTHLTVDAVLTHDKASELRRSGVRVVTQALLAGPNGSFWSQRSFTVRILLTLAIAQLLVTGV